MGKRAVVSCIIAFVLFAGSAFGQEIPNRRWRTQWILSTLALTAANILDARTSAGRNELNPLMRNSNGTFSFGRAFAAKSLTTGSLMVFESFWLRKHPESAKTSAIVNYISAGALAGVAIHNSRVQ